MKKLIALILIALCASAYTEETKESPKKDKQKTAEFMPLGYSLMTEIFDIPLTDRPKYDGMSVRPKNKDLKFKDVQLPIMSLTGQAKGRILTVSYNYDYKLTVKELIETMKDKFTILMSRDKFAKFKDVNGNTLEIWGDHKGTRHLFIYRNLVLSKLEKERLAKESEEKGKK